MVFFLLPDIIFIKCRNNKVILNTNMVIMGGHRHCLEKRVVGGLSTEVSF